jgi:hypothetical protein
MKNNLFYKLTSAAFMVVLGTCICAQDLVFDPSLLEPDPDGYYLAGYIKNEIFYDSCTQEFQESHHFETGTQQGFDYENCMIMPTCPPKDEPPVVSIGYIQMAKAWYLGTDSATFGSITSPPIGNLTRLYLEVSPDVTPRSDRHVITWIEYSLNEGEIWEDIYAQYIIEEQNKKGDTVTFLPGQDFAFEAIATASQSSPVTLRIRAGTYPGEESQPQRVRIHKIKIWADYKSGITSHISYDKPFEIINNLIIALKGTVIVYNILGKLIDTGKTVYVNEGVYIVRTADGCTHKVCIRP